MSPTPGDPSGALVRRAVLSLALLGGYVLLGVGVAVALMSVPWLEARYGTLTLPGMGAGVLGVVVLASLLPPLPEKAAPFLPPAEDPRLRATIDALATSAGVRAPDELYVLPTMNAFVGTRRVSWVERRRTLGVGLPMLAAMDADAVRAVLAHEFGHEVGGDTVLAPWVYASRRFVERSLERLDARGVGVRWLFETYGRWYTRVSMSVAREQEHAADALSASLVSADAAARGLQQTHALALHWHVYWEVHVVPALERGLRPPLVQGFERFRMRADLPAVTPPTPSPEDSHPSLAARLARLGADGQAPTSAPPARSLVADLDAVERELVQSFGRDLTFEAVAWDDVGERVWAPRWAELAGQAPVLAQVPAARLPWVLERAGALVREAGLVPFGIVSDEGARRLVRFVLAGVVATRLRACGWRVDADPATGPRLVRGDQSVDPFALTLRWVEERASWDAWAAESEVWFAPVTDA